MSVLQVRDLRISFGRRRLIGVDGLSFDVGPRERLGVIGESGSGKSVTALAIMGLLPENAQVSGSIRWRGTELVGMRDRDLARLRARELAMVFQEPLSALDPTMRAGRQVAEALRLHQLSTHDTRARVEAMLAEVGVDDPARIADSYPHQLSGGQRQRVLIAMALINRPDLVICDEPTTALDVTVQARVLTTLDRALDEASAACLFISHDLAVVSRIASRVIVLRDGRMVESGTINDLLTRPRNDYTRALVAAARLDQAEPGSLLPTLTSPGTPS